MIKDSAFIEVPNCFDMFEIFELTSPENELLK